MATQWGGKGFAWAERRSAPTGGIFLYRAWGLPSTQWGTGYFSLEKPLSALDAELRFNIVNWGNTVRFVSTFRLKEGFEYIAGAVAHGAGDVSKAATQVFIENPVHVKVELLGTEVLRQDVFVVQRTEPSSKRGWS